VPKLQSVGQVCPFLRWQRGYPIPSSAAFGQIGDAYGKAVHAFAKEHDIPVVRFKKGESKEATARPWLETAAKEGGEGRVVRIGMAQEKASAGRSWKAKGHAHKAHPHREWGRPRVFVQHFYFYLWDPEWGPAFWKTNAYAPYPIWLWLNGHEWAKRQLEKARIPYEALDHGVPLVRGSGSPAEDLRSPGSWSGPELFLALGLEVALAVDGCGSSRRVRLRVGIPAVRGLRSPRL
jgi:hypothetical protein